MCITGRLLSLKAGCEKAVRIKNYLQKLLSKYNFIWYYFFIFFSVIFIDLTLGNS